VRATYPETVIKVFGSRVVYLPNPADLHLFEKILEYKKANPENTKEHATDAFRFFLSVFLCFFDFFFFKKKKQNKTKPHLSPQKMRKPVTPWSE